MKISLMVTCLGDVIRPGAGQATVRILRRLGHEIDFPAAQTCCGQPLFNSGFAELAREQAKHTIGVFSQAERFVVAPSGSCAAMVKVEYPRLLEDDAEWGPRAQQLADRTFELSDFLVNKLQVVDFGARYRGRVAYHYACHLRLLNQKNEVERLIEHVADATYVPIPRQDQCCGFGGSFSVRYPQISGAMVDDKMACLLTTGADALVSTDAGCLMNIGGRLHRAGHRVEVLHIAELLERRWRAGAVTLTCRGRAFASNGTDERYSMVARRDRLTVRASCLVSCEPGKCSGIQASALRTLGQPSFTQFHGKTLMAKKLEELDGKFWKELKKNAGIKSSGFFKKADASVGKHIEAMNKAREKFEYSQLVEDLLDYQKALDKLAETFDKFIDSKKLDELDEEDMKKKEKAALASDIQEWSQEIAAAKLDLDKKLKKLFEAVSGDLKKLDKLDKQKKKLVWDKSGISDTFNL